MKHPKRTVDCKKRHLDTYLHGGWQRLLISIGRISIELRCVSPHREDGCWNLPAVSSSSKQKPTSTYPQRVRTVASLLFLKSLPVLMDRGPDQVLYMPPPIMVVVPSRRASRITYSRTYKFYQHTVVLVKFSADVCG